MNPDEEVQNALFTLFREFRVSGSAYGVVRYFAQNNLSFPKRAYGGTYVYGRFRDQKTVDSDGHFEHHSVRLDNKEEWKVFLPGRHSAYISWDDFEANQNLLESNRTNIELSGPAWEGVALLTGVILCGKCGRRMTIRYTGTDGIRPVYESLAGGNTATRQPVPTYLPMSLT